MKSCRFALAFGVGFIALFFLFSGLVSALNPDEASLTTVWLNQNPRPGDNVSVIITFTSNTSDQLAISRVGIHFDWMAENEFFTNDLSSSPVIIQSNEAHPFDLMAIQIPPFVSPGSHNYYVAIDGTQGASATSFFWDSPTLTLQVAGSGTGPTPTPTSTPTGGGGQGDLQSLLPIIAIIAVVVIVALLIVILVIRRRRKPKPAEPVITPKPSETKKEQPESSDFNI